MKERLSPDNAAVIPHPVHTSSTPCPSTPAKVERPQPAVVLSEHSGQDLRTGVPNQVAAQLQLLQV
eukprot:95678-Chlamydomonas_euryale.AAC.11